MRALPRLLLVLLAGLAAPGARAADVAYKMTAAPGNKRAALPLLTRYKDAKALARVNATLKAKLREMKCGEGGGDWETTSNVTYARRDVFSIRVRTSYSCDTPYPTNGADQSMTFDLLTGEEVRFADLFEDFKGRKSEVLKALYAGHLADAPPAEDDGCPERYDLEDLENYGTRYHVTSAGLVVQPEFPHVMAACSFPVTVPFARAARLAPPGGLLTRLE